MEPVRVSFCYAREDERLRNELEQHLGALKHSGQIITWYDRKILPGTDWQKEINIHFRTSDVILLLISSHFLDSEYCYGIEMEKALDMYEAGVAHVIPIILRPVDWKTTPLGELQALPTDGKPITTWRDRNAAMLDIIRGIRQVILFVLTQKLEKDVQADDMTTISWRERQDLRAVSSDMQALGWKNVPLEDEKQYEAIEQVLSLDPLNLAAHHWKGGLFFRQAKYQEALAIFEYILQLDPNNALAYRKKGRCLFELENYEEALEALNCALQLRPDDLNASLFKGHVLSALHRNEEALAIFEQILYQNAKNISMYHYIAQELRSLDKSAEAEQAERTYSRRLMEQINPSFLPLVQADGGHHQIPVSFSSPQPEQISHLASSSNSEALRPNRTQSISHKPMTQVVHNSVPHRRSAPLPHSSPQDPYRNTIFSSPQKPRLKIRFLSSIGGALGLISLLIVLALLSKPSQPTASVPSAPPTLPAKTTPISIPTTPTTTPISTPTTPPTATSTSTPTNTPEQLISDFCWNLESSDYKSAYQKYSQKLQNQISFTDFENYWSANHKQYYHIDRCDHQAIPTPQGSSVTALWSTHEFFTGLFMHYGLTFALQGNEWKIDQITFPSTTNTASPEELITGFCTNIKGSPQGTDYRSAYQKYSQKLQNQISFTDFENYWSNNNAQFYFIDRCDHQTIPTPQGSSITATWSTHEFYSGQVRRYSVTFVLQGNEWKIDQIYAI